MRRASTDKPAGVELADRLRARQREIEQETMTCIRGLSSLPEPRDHEYVDGLMDAVRAGIDHAISGVEEVGHRRIPVPDELLSQARRAARLDIPFDMVLRRYVASQNLFGDYIIQEGTGEIPTSELKRSFRRLGAVMDRVLVAVTAAYQEESDAVAGGHEHRRRELVEGLLAGKPFDSQELNYDFESHHLAIVSVGRGARDTLRVLASTLDANLLLLNREEADTSWAWLGGRVAFDADEVLRRAEEAARGETVAIGESAVGLSGWRMSHRQATAALRVAARVGPRVVRYADVAVISALMQDDILAHSLRRIYLDPLDDGQDGPVLRQTLCAYFSAGRNGASAASSLGVSRQTVNHRLRKAEQRIGRPLMSSALDLEAVLRLDAR
jgi:PucR C-terminal helix-turn-helix domain/GGDEF-like domain